MTADDGQLPRQHQHGDHGADEADDVEHGVAGGRGHHLLDAGYVVGHAGLDLASASAGKEAQGHPLQVGINGVAQVAHHVLPDPVGHVGLGNAQHRVARRDSGHDRSQDPQQPHIWAALREQAVVEHVLDEDRVDHPKACRDEHQQHHESNLRLVRPEEAHHAGHQSLGRPGARSGRRSIPHQPEGSM